MDKTLKIYILFLVLFIAGIVYIDAVRPRPINWTPTYDLRDKIPFGLLIFDQESKNLFPKDTIEKVSTTAYEFLNPKYDYDTLVNNYNVKGTLLSISEYYSMDDESTNELFYFVSKGNSVFLSAKYFNDKLYDSLHIETAMNPTLEKDIVLSLANPKLGKESYPFNIGASSTYFNKIDTLTTVVLGHQIVDKKKQINFIKVPYRGGYFYFHTQPAAFTNYHLLKDNHFEYTEKICSYLPNNSKIFWLVKGQNGEVISNSPMRFVLSKPALKGAWFTFLLGMLVFILFNAKRRQRIVPIIKPFTNTTVDFTKTIGNLYYQEGDHQNIINKKIIYFLERIRNEYLIETSILDENFVKKLHLKSGKNIQDIENVVRLINYQKKSYNQSIEEDLLEINKVIEKILN